MKTSNPKEYIQEILLFYTCMQGGIVTRDSIVEWADGFIAKDREPDCFFIELSLAKNIKEIFSCFSEFLYANYGAVTQISPPVPLGAVLCKVYEALLKEKMDLYAVTTWLSYLGEDGNVLMSDDESALVIDYQYSFDLSFMDSVGFMSRLEHSFMEFLSVYKDYTLASREFWGNQDKLIEEKLKNIVVPQAHYYVDEPKPKKYRPWWKFW